jgi:molybdenum cofactor cytidylyltransferase
MQRDTAPVTAILLAAGLSTRMGRPKPLLPWGGRTLVACQVEALWGASVADVVVVTGHEAGAVTAALEGTGARIAHNSAYAAGRAGSVRAGALAVPDGSDVLVLNVDQPRDAALIRAVLDAHRAAGGLITVPVYEGRRGHPVVFAAALLPALRTVTEATEGLRAVMRAHADAVVEVPVDDPRVLLDINTPDTYRKALEGGLGAEE